MTTVRNIAIAGGGTAGHVNPALAIADAYRDQFGANVVFIGTASGLETRLVPARGYPLELVDGSRLVGGSVAAKLKGIVGLIKGVAQARALLKKHGVKLVVGVGGYASGAALLAARTMGLATAVHESNAVPGLTNKVLGRLVDRVYLGFEAAKSAFPQARVRVTGNPVRAEIEQLDVQRGLPTDGSRPVRILVVGGSQGALFLNQNVPALLAEVAANGIALTVRHQVGKLAPEPVAQAYADTSTAAEVIAYIDDMADAYKWADFAITRAGSGTVSELAAAKLPALLVPFPYAAGDHQAANAKAFSDAGGGLWQRQKDWNSEKLAQSLISLMANTGAMDRAVKGAYAVARPDAARAVVADCEQLMEGRW